MALTKYFDSDKESIASRLRQKRFALFRTLIDTLPRPIRILDVGGTPSFWERMGMLEFDNVRVKVVNLDKFDTPDPRVESLEGDAWAMPYFSRGDFDVVFSNSVIEHVGTLDDQRTMAREVQRIGSRYFVQTPNRYFPIEPHFLFPFFQFLPFAAKVFLISHFRLGWIPKAPNKAAAEASAREIRLMSGKELREIFPNGKLYREKFLGLTKSYIIIWGLGTVNFQGVQLIP